MSDSERKELRSSGQKIAAALADRFVEVQGATMHFMTNRAPLPAGTPVIIFVHGLTVSYRYMCPVACELVDTYRVYIPDLPGFGKSSKPANALDLDGLAAALIAWMDAMQIERAAFVGNSLGCQILARLALHYPERATHLVMTGPTMDNRARTAHQEITRWLINILREPLSLYPIVVRDALDIGFRRFRQTFHYGLQDNILQHLTAISIPTLIVRGTRDTIVPQRWAEEVTKNLPHGRLITIPNAAHDLNYNSPLRLSRTIRTFLEYERYAKDLAQHQEET